MFLSPWEVVGRTGFIEDRVVERGTFVEWSVGGWRWDWVMGVAGTIQVVALWVDVILEAALAGFEHSCR